MLFHYSAGKPGEIRMSDFGHTGGALGFGVGGAVLLAKLFLTGKNDEDENDSEEQGVTKPKTKGNAGGTSPPKRRKR